MRLQLCSEFGISTRGPLFNVSIVRSKRSPLFAYVKDAFTGANTDRARLPSITNNGMLFLDEIGEFGLLGPLDLFDEVQLEAVLNVCATSSTVSEAGRKLFAQSRAEKTSSNDADRLRKYLARFGLSFEQAMQA